MARRLLFAPLVALLYLSAPTLAHAQEPPPSDPDRPTLPDIAPREVEIRGRLEVAFPSLERQPLIGFNAPPRLMAFDADRRPFIEDYEQVRTETPEADLARPAPPSVAGLAGWTPIRGAIEGAAGRYFTRRVRAHAGSGLSDRVTLLADLRYGGTDGHRPFDDPERPRAAADRFRGQAGVEVRGDGLSGGLDLEAFHHDYTLYGLAGTASTPSREGAGLSLQPWLRTHGPTRVDVRLDVGSTRYETRTGSGTGADTAERTATTLGGTLDLTYPTGAGEALFDTRLYHAGLDGGDLARGLDLGGGYGFLWNRRLQLQLGGRVLAYTTTDGEAAAAGLDHPQGVYLTPTFRAELYPAHGMRVYVQQRPGLEMNRLAGLFSENPYLSARPRLQPTVRQVDAEAGGQVFVGLIQLAARVGYQRYPNLRVYTHDPARTDVAQGLLALRYERAEILRIGGDLSLVLPTGLHATVGLTVRDARLPAFDADIPHMGDVLGRGVLGYRFAGSRGLFQLVGRYESVRYRDLARSRRLGDYIAVDASLAYDFTPALGLVVLAENLGGADYLELWDQYPEAGTVLMAGLRVRW